MKPVLLSIVLAMALVVVVVDAKPLWHELDESYSFEQYTKDFRKNYYSSAEREKRRAIFTENMKGIMEHNAKDLSWKHGVNHMTDMTHTEFKRLNGYRRDLAHKQLHSANPPKIHEVDEATFDEAAYPDALDWREYGAVTPVKDQGQCGSCWTFATAETMESALFLSAGKLVELSEQQVASCSPNPQQCGGSGGCEGGTAEIGFNGVMVAGGVSSEWVYPYVSHSGVDFACNKSLITPVAQVVSYVKLPNNSYAGLMDAIVNVGPIAVSVDASSWQHYESGVFSGCNTTDFDIDHAVQAVGYGVDNGVAYWWVRNSWTPSWGEDGYIRIQRNSGVCNWDYKPCDGTACLPCPDKEWVCGMCGILIDSAYPIMKSV